MITIQGTPTFVFPANPVLIEALEKCARLHYDSTCRATADEHGLIGRWKVAAQLHRDSRVPELETVRASWRDLDLVLKVCEFLGHLGHLISHEEMKELHRFKGEARRAMIRANELYNVWREEVL